MLERIISFISAPDNSVLPQVCGIYPKSIHRSEDGVIFMARIDTGDVLVAPASSGFEGQSFPAGDRTYVAAGLSHSNAAVLRGLFPFTAPAPVLKHPRTLGVGDRLGIAAPGHIRAFEEYDAYPVFAQQSIRELTLTGRTYDDVIDCVSFFVFRDGFTKGFGADGDHVKTPSEVEYAISSGCSMITLDCSEHINNAAADMTDGEVAKACAWDPDLEGEYLNRTFRAGKAEVSYNETDLRRICLMYNGAIEFAASVYERFLRGREGTIDFEISIDETKTPTTPAQHFYIANELISRGVKVASLAPRFIGEFQKGIDYRGSLERFEMEFEQHAEIADYFGYKISIHSGSDKFSVFPIVGRHTGGRFHLKTAGTSWLEAMAVIADNEPELYREIHAFALEEGFKSAKDFYNVSADLSRIPQLDSLSDGELRQLFEQDDARQLIHITYGAILSAKNPDGSDRFRSRLYAAWHMHEEEYARRLSLHIGQHLEKLYSGFRIL
ncbi:MAG: hypothetical protein GXX89_01880 [Clostridiales bacterium]|jgi:hypothetical protein|nr:hypothetical protein [Clostridiales bacterium]